MPVPDTGTFTYTRRMRSLSGMDFTVWTSTDLTDWTQDTAAIQTATGGPGAERESVSVTLSPPLRNQSRLFVRIQAR